MAAITGEHRLKSLWGLAVEVAVRFLDWMSGLQPGLCALLALLCPVWVIEPHGRAAQHESEIQVVGPEFCIRMPVVTRNLTGELRCLTSHAACRLQVGLVSQEPTLFQTSILENIALGRPGATEEEVFEAARKANAHKFISAMPAGYNTQVRWRSSGSNPALQLLRGLVQDLMPACSRCFRSGLARGCFC